MASTEVRDGGKVDEDGCCCGNLCEPESIQQCIHYIHYIQVN